MSVIFTVIFSAAASEEPPLRDLKGHSGIEVKVCRVVPR